MASALSAAPVATEVDVVIVGAGLSGLTSAYKLLKQNPTAVIAVVEARKRIGGRTQNGVSGHDLGGAWCWKRENPRLTALSEEVGVRMFRQLGDTTNLLNVYERPNGAVQKGPNDEASQPAKYRFEGGAAALVQRLNTLCHSLSTKKSYTLQTDSVVNSIDASSKERVVIQGTRTEGTQKSTFAFSAKAVIVAVPPRVALSFITFTPALSKARVLAMTESNTWMSGTGKVVVSYDEPFWRDSGFTGTGYSQRGPLVQIYDASMPSVKAEQKDKQDAAAAAAIAAPERPALCGFLMSPYTKMFSSQSDTDAAKGAVVQQLQRLFGPKAAKPKDINFMVWTEEDEPFTGAVPKGVQGDHGGHPMPDKMLSTPHGAATGGRVLFAGAEASLHNTGLLDGAVTAGEQAASRALSLISKQDV